MATAPGADASGGASEPTGCQAVFSQVYASIAAASYHIVIGISLSYSAILIPQLMSEQKAANGTDKAFISINKESASWIASVLTIINIPSSLCAICMIDTIGRLNLIRVAAVPMFAGWIVIAIANDVTMLIIGRLLTGLAGPWATSSGGAYITEISSPHLRGSLISLNSLCVSFGMLVGYVEGWIMNWRIVSWTCLAYSALPVVLLMCVPESSAYLTMKGRDEQALKSYKWFRKSEEAADVDKSFAIQREKILKHKQEQTAGEGSKFSKMMQKFKSPAFYKPLIIVNILFFFQHFAGIFMTLFYAVIFMQEVGTHMDPFLASVYLGLARFGMSLLNFYLFGVCKRRHMLIVSTLGMGISMAISGTFTKWVHDGVTDQNWVPVVMIIVYIISSMVGLLALPFIFAAELFPLEVRGAAQSIIFSLSNLAMFLALKFYFTLLDLFGGVAGMQYYFSVMSFIAFVFTFIFVPESHNKKLPEIEEYFLKNTVYLPSGCCEKKPQPD